MSLLLLGSDDSPPSPPPAPVVYAWTLPYDDVEDLVTVALGSVPQDIANRSRSLDETYALAEQMALAKNVADGWTRNAQVSFAVGEYLAARARERGYVPQADESDELLRSRIVTAPKAVSSGAVLAALQAVVDANGGGPVVMLELPRDAAYVSRAGYLNRSSRIGGGTKMVIALIPASANCLSSCLDTLRAKVSAGKLYTVQEYT